MTNQLYTILEPSDVTQVSDLIVLSTTDGWAALSIDVTRAKYLTVIGRTFDRRYGGIPGWSCLMDNTDSEEHCPTFLISSGDIKGKGAFEDSKEIANNIKHHLNHKGFCNLYLK